MSRTRMGELLLQIAADEQLDHKKISEFERLLAETKRDRLLGMAVDELTEYRLTWQPLRNVFGMVTQEKPSPGELEEYRDNLAIFGRALLSNITEFKSLDDLKRLLDSNNTGSDSPA